MIKPLPREKMINLTDEPLGAGWLRRSPTLGESLEEVGHSVWRTGSKLCFRDALVAGLNSASDIALISSFLLADDRLAEAILAAANRGVRVYVLTASEQRIGKIIREEDEFEQRMADQHKTLLNSLAGKALLRSAEHIHAKFLVVDPHLENEARAWLSTANFNKALESSVELGVRLNAQGARALADCFNWAFWCEAERELREGRLMAIKPGFPASPLRPSDGAIFATLKDGTALREQLLVMIHQAHSEILVASYGIEANHIVVQALIAAAKRGVRVTVVTRPRPAVADGVLALALAGIAIFGHDKLHAKAVVVDGQAMVMSANLESHGLDSGFEVGVMLPSDQAKDIESTLREWMGTFPWVYRHDAMRGEHLGDFCPAKQGLRDVERVTELHEQRAPEMTADDVFRLDATPEPVLKPAIAPKVLPQYIKFTWAVQPPHLPKGAKERYQQIEREEKVKGGKVKKIKSQVAYDPPVFDYQGRGFIVLKDLDKADSVQQAAKRHNAKVVLP